MHFDTILQYLNQLLKPRLKLSKYKKNYRNEPLWAWTETMHDYKLIYAKPKHYQFEVYLISSIHVL